MAREFAPRFKLGLSFAIAALAFALPDLFPADPLAASGLASSGASDLAEGFFAIAGGLGLSGVFPFLPYKMRNAVVENLTGRRPREQLRAPFFFPKKRRTVTHEPFNGITIDGTANIPQPSEVKQDREPVPQHVALLSVADNRSAAEKSLAAFREAKQTFAQWKRAGDNDKALAEQNVRNSLDVLMGSLPDLAAVDRQAALRTTLLYARYASNKCIAFNIDNAPMLRLIKEHNRVSDAALNREMSRYYCAKIKRQAAPAPAPAA